MNTVDNTNRNFKGQQPQEVVLCFCRKHWIVIFYYMLSFIVTTALIIFIFSITTAPGVRASTSPRVLQVVALFSIIFYTWHFHYVFVKIFNYFLRTLIITNMRVVDLDKTLFFRHNLDSTDLHEMKDVTMSQEGILKTILNYGEITVIRGNELVLKTHYCIPNPNYHFRKINQAKREYLLWRTRQKGGLREEALGQQQE